MRTRVKLSIGDWSEDGHNEYEQLVYNSNKSVTEIQQAYKDSCKLTGLQFNENTNFTGLKEHGRGSYATKRHICCDYQEPNVSEFARKILEEHNINPKEDYSFDAEGFAELIIDFIKLSLPDLVLDEASYKKSELYNIDVINGWWNDNLNVGFGYGLFYE